MLRALLGAFLGLVLLGIVAVGAGYWWLNDRYLDAPGPLAEPAIVDLPRGTGVAGIAERLSAAGVIGDPRLFRAAVRLHGRDRNLKAGEYRFEPNVRPAEVLATLEAGRVLLHGLTIPEGVTVAEALRLVAADPVLDGPLPEAPTEGSLLPETYLFGRGTTRARAVGRMEAAMHRTLERAWEGRAEGLPLERPDDLLTLASIIEKETAVAGEYGVVAGVFVNRLNKGMPLQTDPTVIYALTLGKEPLGRALTRKDLATDSPYNTYRVRGLPPTPIALPGRAAIEAAAHPAETDYVYFVADGSGGHAFAKTLAEHNRNVAAWRRLNR